MSYDYAQAKKMADEIVSVLKPFCVQCEIAGSIRRLKQHDIKDVEIVLVPANAHIFALREKINHQWGAPSIGVFPSKYTKIPGAFDIDIFTCSPETFGLNYFIRTGSDEFAKRALAHWKKITGGGYSEGARLHLKDGTPIATPTEQDVFDALKCPFVPPEKRK